MKLMFKFNIDIPKEPIVNIQTTENRGFTPDEVAERCVEKLISVSDITSCYSRSGTSLQKAHGKSGCILYARSYSQ